MKMTQSNVFRSSSKFVQIPGLLTPAIANQSQLRFLKFVFVQGIIDLVQTVAQIWLQTLVRVLFCEPSAPTLLKN